MGKGRLEAFSDGVLAIILTIMVLEMKVPAGDDLSSLRPLIPVFMSYVLSFVYIGVYWSNHHHLLHACRRVSGAVLGANLALLFWLSLLPLATGWIGRHPTAVMPTVLYGVVLLLSGGSYRLLEATIVRADGPGSVLGRAVGSDHKGAISLLLYAGAIAVAIVSPWVAQGLYAVVALMWLVPDRRIERALKEAA
jgi:uncharacterized membrane protein